MSRWSGANRGEIAVSLFLAAVPLRIRLSFEIRAGFAKLKVTPAAFHHPQPDLEPLHIR
ncbi:hypothetical protein ACFQHW_03745 [Lapidilactobacillus achengensis]|uniref:Uncharacterized protein n=1 Tax=Lapidilactobacillus achengensis TaxID=2486000 RepID=A0ABW1UMW4_9LACO|nr:hypothetical protein [Lapidilactobacillus achengensis]